MACIILMQHVLTSMRSETFTLERGFDGMQQGVMK